MSSRRIHSRIAAVALLPFAFLACDEDSTGPDATASGSVSAVVHDGSGSSLRANQAFARAFSGSAEGSAQVQVYSEARGWVALDSPSQTTVTLQSENTSTIHSSSRVDADTDTRVRLILDGFDANIAAGATIGGTLLDSAVSIRIGGSDGRVEVEKEITPFTVSAESEAMIVFDLNSEAWVDEESANSETTTDAEVESATTAHVQS